MYKIGVIGDKQSVQGFAALSIDVYPATDEREIRHLIHALAKDDYAIVFITEAAAALAAEAIERYKTQPFPAIIPVPSNRGTLGIGMDTIKKNVEKAVGTDLFFEE